MGKPGTIEERKCTIIEIHCKVICIINVPSPENTSAAEEETGSKQCLHRNSNCARLLRGMVFKNLKNVSPSGHMYVRLKRVRRVS